MVVVDWVVDKQIWEQYKEEEEGGEEIKIEKKKVKKVKKEEEKEEEEDLNMIQEDCDLVNFFKNYGKNFEDEVEDDDEDVNSEDEDEDDDEEKDLDEEMDEDGDVEFEDVLDDEEEEVELEKKLFIDNFIIVFICNFFYIVIDEQFKVYFEIFGVVRYVCVVKECGIDWFVGIGFVCFFNYDDYVFCFKGVFCCFVFMLVKYFVLQDEIFDFEGMYIFDGCIFQVVFVVDKSEVVWL